MMVVPNEVTVNKQTNITINNNTWNGNIYQDNSTNLTYIYPQYTTINENNETVTNISNNPIIYNNETKQYYTYDSVTNNYYYITYEAPTPSPSPDPTPTPDPGTDPTPTPKPDGSGDVSTPESGKPGSSSGGQSWWEKLLGKIGDAIVDGLLGAISAVLKLIFKLFTTILGWIIWLVSQVLTLFPFLPPGLGALLIGGGQLAHRFFRDVIEGRGSTAMQYVGYLDAAPREGLPAYLGTVDSLYELLQTHKVDMIVLAQDVQDVATTQRIMMLADNFHLRVAAVPSAPAPRSAPWAACGSWTCAC